MNIKKYEKLLTKSIFIFPLIMVLMGISITSISFFIALKNFQHKEILKLKENLINEHKQILKNSVDNIDEDIKISMNSLIQQEKEKNKLDIETISETILAIHNMYHNKNHQFLRDILNTVNKIRKRRYFGVIDMSSKKMIIHPIKKVLNKDTSKMQLGKFSLYEWVKNTTNNKKHEGFFTVTFYKPKTKKQITKIVFVKYIPTLNWAIGTGEYLDEIIKQIKKDIIKKIISKKGNFSVIDADKNNYAIHNNYLKKLNDLTIGKFISTQKELIYVKYNPELNIIIQKGINLKKINFFINKERFKINNIYNKFYKILLLIIIIITIISILISIILSKKIQVIFKTYEQLHNDKIKAQYEAYHDPLTGAYNRAFFNKQMEIEIQKIKLTKNNLTIAIIDIDHFKKINDTYGHQSGDMVLKKLVKFMQNNLRENDIFARWGGEEFVIIFKSTCAKIVKQRLEQIKHNLQQDIKVQSPIKFTFSCGIAQHSNEDDSNSLLKKADEALYEAKKTRNTIVIYSKRN